MVTAIVAEKISSRLEHKEDHHHRRADHPGGDRPIPASTKITSSVGAHGSKRCTISEQAAPKRLPRYKEELNMPPRNPLPIDTAEPRLGQDQS
jgi:hypothetical protein